MASELAELANADSWPECVHLNDQAIAGLIDDLAFLDQNSLVRLMHALDCDQCFVAIQSGPKSLWLVRLLASIGFMQVVEAASRRAEEA